MKNITAKAQSLIDNMKGIKVPFIFKGLPFDMVFEFDYEWGCFKWWVKAQSSMYDPAIEAAENQLYNTLNEEHSERENASYGELFITKYADK